MYECAHVRKCINWYHSSVVFTVYTFKHCPKVYFLIQNRLSVIGMYTDKSYTFIVCHLVNYVHTCMRHAIWFWQLSGLMTDETMWNVILHEIMVLSWQSLNRQRKSFLKVLIYLKQYQFNIYVVDLDQAKNKKGTYRNENSYSRLHLGETFQCMLAQGYFIYVPCIFTHLHWQTGIPRIEFA